MIVSGGFDHYRLREVRSLEEASKRGSVELLLTPDGEFPIEERIYLWSACRYVEKVTIGESIESDLTATDADSIPTFTVPDDLAAGTRPKVVVTGCFDWLHSGHIRFFEEAATYGELTVVVGSDRNVKLLKGPHHPMFAEAERRYLAASVRHVTRCLVSSGEGWMDAAPEIERMRPDVYIVNEDGDKPDKRAFCRERGIEYVVLRRVPAEGLPKRESTKLRGF